MMTPQIYAKLTAQIARQTPEAEALEAQAAAMQLGIDSAQAWADSCQASVDNCLAALDAVMAINAQRTAEAEAAEATPDLLDTTAQQAALQAAQDNLQPALDDLGRARARQDMLIAHASQIRAQIAQCQAALEHSGLTMTQAEIDAVLNAPVVPQQISPGQGELQLLREGLLDDVRAVLANPYTPPEMQIAFARATVWERQSPSVIAMLGMLGKTDAEADAFFVAASQIRL